MSDEFPERARYRLILPPVPMIPPTPQQVAVMLMCSCGACTVLAFGSDAVGETGRSGVCGGCGTEHWFRVPPPPPPEEDG